MNRRRFLQAAALQVAKPRQEAPLNFVVIIVDDLGWRDVGFNGSKFCETPNIDRLAAQGMRFSNAYAASPVCSPSRASLLTGRYPARLGITNTLPGRHQLLYSKLTPPLSAQFLPLEETTIAEELKAIGYATASIGKWQLGGARYYPQNQGFDINAGGTQKEAANSHFYPQWDSSPPITAPPGSYLADTLTGAAEDFIHGNAAKPFLLWLAHYGVHTPLEAKAEAVLAFQKKSDPNGAQHNPVYAAMVQSIDESVGRVVQRVAAEGLTDRTVFIFTSDNGGLVSADPMRQIPTSNLPLKGGMGFLYEGGIRVPMFIVWPGVTKPGGKSDMPVMGCDLYRTIAQMAGIPKLKGDPKDGVSLTPLLRRGLIPARERLFWHYPHYSTQGGKPGGAIRLGDWKLIRWYEDDSVELYNLRTDPGEKKNLAADQPAKARGMLAMFNEWLTKMNPQMPKPNRSWDADVANEGLEPAVQEQLKNGELPSPSGVTLT